VVNINARYINDLPNVVNVNGLINALNINGTNNDFTMIKQ